MESIRVYATCFSPKFISASPSHLHSISFILLATLLDPFDVYISMTSR